MSSGACLRYQLVGEEDMSDWPDSVVASQHANNGTAVNWTVIGTQFETVHAFHPDQLAFFSWYDTINSITISTPRASAIPPSRLAHPTSQLRPYNLSIRTPFQCPRNGVDQLATEVRAQVQS